MFVRNGRGLKNKKAGAAYLESIQRLFFPLHVLKHRSELGIEFLPPLLSLGAFAVDGDFQRVRLRLYLSCRRARVLAAPWAARFVEPRRARDAELQ